MENILVVCGQTGMHNFATEEKRATQKMCRRNSTFFRFNHVFLCYINDFYNLIKGEEVSDEDALDEAIAFSGVSQFPARVKCATLAWKALGTILESEK